MLDSGRWAVTVNELEQGQFHFTILEAASGPEDLLCFTPIIVDDTEHPTEMGAWVAGICELANYQAISIAPMPANPFA